MSPIKAVQNAVGENKLAFWLVTVLFVAMITILTSVTNNWFKQTNDNFKVLFDKIDNMATKSEMEALKNQVQALNIRLTIIEAKTDGKDN